MIQVERNENHLLIRESEFSYNTIEVNFADACSLQTILSDFVAQVRNETCNQTKGKDA